MKLETDHFCYTNINMYKIEYILIHFIGHFT